MNTIQEVSVDILNHKQNICLPYEIGEITVHGSGVMKGYYQDEELTRITIVDNKLKTSDLGYKDVEGNIYVVGRKDNMFICLGKNIYPEEIEDVLMSYNSITGVYVKKEENEKIVAYIETNCSDFNRKELLNHCRNNLEDYKIPNKIISVNHLERTSSGKIIREYYDNK